MRGVLLPQWRAEAVEVTFGKTTDVQACGQRSVGENFNSVVGKEDALGSVLPQQGTSVEITLAPQMVLLVSKYFKTIFSQNLQLAPTNHAFLSLRTQEV